MHELNRKAQIYGINGELTSIANHLHTKIKIKIKRKMNIKNAVTVNREQMRKKK